jgi:hypothetical protein
MTLREIIGQTSSTPIKRSAGKTAIDTAMRSSSSDAANVDKYLSVTLFRTALNDRHSRRSTDLRQYPLLAPLV